MFYFIFLGTLALIILLLFIFFNKKELVSRRFKRIISARSGKKIQKLYMGRFREHRESRLGRNIIIQIFPFLVVVGLIFFLGNQYVYFGTVLSGSMEPIFKKGDLVLMQSMYKEPYVGDIISTSIYGYREPITHRVSAINDNGIRTKGDNNAAQDNWVVKKDKVIGKAVILGGSPVIIRGLGGILVDEAGEFTIMTKMTRDLGTRRLFYQFRSVQPLIIFFMTIFYFFILIETKMEEEKRFGKKRDIIKNIR